MKLIGPLGALSFLVGPAQDHTSRIEIWVDNKHLTSNDSSAYLPAFLPSVASTIGALKGQLNFLAHERLFFGLGAEEAHRKMVSSGTDREVASAWSSLQLMHWGPTTDSFLCFLLPVFGKLHLSFSTADGRFIQAMAVVPYDLIRLLEALRDEISAGHETPLRSDA